MAAAKPIVAGKQITWAELCTQVLGPVSNVKVQRIGSLWGGYGSVTEVNAHTENRQQKLIAKQVCNTGTDPCCSLFNWLIN